MTFADRVKRMTPVSTHRFLRYVYVVLTTRVPTKVRSRVRLIQQIGERKISSSELKTSLLSAGISAGQTIMVHSSLSSIGHVDGGPNAVIDSLKETITPNGTILMPAYNDSFFQQDSGYTVDLRTERTSVGAITERFRSSPEVYRSSHPFQSICAWGKNAQHITSNHQDDPEICHVNSPLARFVELNGKIVGIGTSLGQVAVYHVIEDTWDGFPFRIYQNPIRADYIDSSGNTITRDIRIRDSIVASTRIEKTGSKWIRNMFDRHLTRKGILHWFHFGRAKSFVIESQPLCAELRRLAEKGITIYLTKERWKSMNGGEESIDSW